MFYVLFNFLKDWSERGEERSLILVRILILVRNVLNVPCDVDTEKRPDNDANTHDQVIVSKLYMNESNFLILYYRS